VLRDSFDVPLARLTYEDGKETKRTVLAGPGARGLLEGGMIANALLFHPPFPRDRDEWQADVEIGTGQGATAKGKLTYKKAPGGKGGQAVKVSGTLTHEGDLPGKVPVRKKVTYTVRGEQVYDRARGEWSSGRLLMDISLRVTAPDGMGSTGKGTMDARLE